jgi:hypothetical protein
MVYLWYTFISTNQNVFYYSPCMCMRMQKYYHDSQYIARELYNIIISIVTEKPIPKLGKINRVCMSVYVHTCVTSKYQHLLQ